MTEREIVQGFQTRHLRTDLLPRLRIQADNVYRIDNPYGQHPWMRMDDETLLRSAGLFRTDILSQKQGYTRAAVLLLGSDEIIREVAPTYATDALIWRVDQERCPNGDAYADAGRFPRHVATDRER